MLFRSEDVYGAFQNNLKQPVFSIVGKNVKPEKKERFYAVIQEVLEKMVKEGLPQHLLRGALQVKEFDLRESDSSGYSKGLFYGLAAMKSWVYDDNPLTYLKYEKELEDLKANIGTGYFENLIKYYLLENNHCAKVELYPKQGLEKEIEDEVTAKLTAYKASLSEAAIDALVEETKRFNDYQMAAEPEGAVDCIPLLEREDLRTKAKFPKYEVKEKNAIPYVVTPIFTNQIGYINWYVNIEGVDRKSTCLNSSHTTRTRMPSTA